MSEYEELARRVERAVMIDEPHSYQEHRGIRWLGETKTLSQWAKEYGMIPATLSNRVRHGWTFGRALLTPVTVTMEAPQRKVYRGLAWLWRNDGLTLREIGERLNLSVERVRQMLAKTMRQKIPQFNHPPGTWAQNMGQLSETRILDNNEGCK